MGLGLIMAATGGTEAAGASQAEAGKDIGDRAVDAAKLLPGIAEAAAIALVSILIAIAILMLVWTMSKRIRGKALVVRPFTDEAVETKVGTGMASLVEERLVGALRRKDRGDDEYDLDRVAIDIELLAEDDALSKAVERLADVPQFQLVVAVMDLMERLLPSRGLSAAGELLPAGRGGAGVALALYKGSRLTARSSLWEHEVELWFPGEGWTNGSQAGTAAGGDGGSAADPSSHYGLAAPAAWWVQYEAARALDGDVPLVTNSAPSFSLVGIGLARERQRLSRDAEDAYAGALSHDPGNVAALFNLAQLLARKHNLYLPASLLLVRAEESLADRHRQRVG